MKKVVIFIILLVNVVGGFSQTLTDTQMRNARATGYAIVAARNPGQSFSIYMIPWDGINSLESNANTQINSGWHAQAAVKGNYFYQDFNGSDFSSYSSVVLSQTEFDQFKSTGTQWWIVCSTLPSFSSSISTNTNGNVGIGTNTPELVTHILGTTGFPANSGTNQIGVLRLQGSGSNGVLDFSINAGLGATLQVSNRSNLALAYPLILNPNGGNVGIGTTAPDAKLAVKGTVHANEVKVDLNGAVAPDYVFNSDYNLLSLEEIKTYIDINKHLPEVPSAKEMEANGVQLGEMNMLLLKKIEELTLHLIEQSKKIEDQDKRMLKLETENTEMKALIKE